MSSRNFRIKDRLILGLTIFGEIMREFQDPGGFVSFSYKKMYGFTPDRYKRHNYNVLVNRLIKTKELNKIVKNGEAYLVISDSNGTLLKKFPYFKLLNNWDRKLRIAIYDIEELARTRRESLRKKLKQIGFGMWQQSVWVTPLPIEKEFKEFLKDQKLSSFVHIFCIKVEEIEELQLFANKVWRIDEINNKYIEWILDVNEKEEKHKKSQELLKEQFWEIVSKDPFLPSIFLPVDWKGKEAFKLFKYKFLK